MSSHPALDLPLHGVQRIEASAGTGKTFALALLHLRLVIERGLALRQVLAVTFTEAATQELRERLRRQLERAVRVAGDSAARAAALQSDDAADVLTATLILRRAEHESVQALTARLRQAVADIDLAAVFTIHGWCRRVLSDHALFAGASLLPREMLTSEAALWQEVATDLWRRHTRTLAQAERLASLFGDPASLAYELPRLVRAEVLLPAAAPVDTDAPRAARARAAAQLRDAWRQHGDAARARIEAAHAAKIFNGNRLRRDTLAKLWIALDTFAAGSGSDASPHECLSYLTPDGLRDRASKGRVDEVPVGPVSPAIAAFLDADADFARVDGQARANLLHELRAQAALRATQLKTERAQRGFDDLIAGVGQGLQRDDGDALAAALRTQYPVALVDEFQDTDAQQWEIFRRIYAGHDDTALYLIGDPKQAIYRFRGGDVDTYHRAARDVEQTAVLDANFRSRPRVLDAIEALFRGGGEHPFADEATRFAHVAPGGRLDDGALRVDAMPAAALHAWHLPLADTDLARNRGKDRPPALRVEAARRLAARGAAARIRTLLDDGRWRRDERGGQHTLQARDIAVLVGNHKEAALVQRELAAHGIPAVTAGRASLYASEEALELQVLLIALLEAGDEGRRRAALATRLLGLDAVALDALGGDEAAHRHWLEQFQDWRARWDRHGPLALLAERIAAAAPRLLRLADGERRLTNYLQLSEQLQEASARVLGAAGLIDWLAQRIADADERDSTQQLRLESDAQRVRVLTLHASKGLEFDLVLLPFLLIAPDERERGLALLDYRDPLHDVRVLHAKIDGLDDAAYAAGREIAKRERLAEQLRLLYVGVTRTRLALWLTLSAVHGGERSALAWLLGGGAVPEAFGDAWLRGRFDALAATVDAAIMVEDAPATPTVPRALPTPPAAPAPRVPRRNLRRDWWVYSFSQLARDAAASAEAEQGAEDEAPVLLDPTPFAGARFGNALHAALERVDFPAWRGWRASSAPPAQASVLAQALDEHGFDVVDQRESGLGLLATLVRDTLNVALPEGVRLCDLAPTERRSELEFHFALQPVEMPALVALLHAHGLMTTRTSLGLRERIEGLMTGKIDLVYRHDARWYLLDYKSNRLPGYDADALAVAMREHDYELQYAIYTLALHRWLRFRVPGYDYARDFGGVRYLFCRGLDPTLAPSPGVIATRLSPPFVDALDRLFGVPQEAAA